MSKPAISRPLRILVVENHADIRRILKIYLEYLGHTVTTAGTKAEAIRNASASECDVLLSEIGLADGDGWDILKEAKFARPVFAIAMSGYAISDDRMKSVHAGFRQHIEKPFDLDLLDQLLDQAAREIAASG